MAWPLPEDQRVELTVLNLFRLAFHLVICISGFCLSCYNLMAPSVSSLNNNDFVNTYHFVHSFTDWRSSWLLPVLAITTKAATNIVWWFMFRRKFSIRLDKYQGVQLLDHILKAGLDILKAGAVLCGTGTLCSTVTAPLCLRAPNKRSCRCTPSLALGISILDLGHSRRRALLSHLTLWFSGDLGRGASFPLLIGIFCFTKHLLRYSVHLLTTGFLFSYFWVIKFVNFRYQSFIR